MVHRVRYIPVLQIPARFLLGSDLGHGGLGEVADEHFGGDGDGKGRVGRDVVDVVVLDEDFFDTCQGEGGGAGDFVGGGDGGVVVGHLGGERIWMKFSGRGGSWRELETMMDVQVKIQAGK